MGLGVTLSVVALLAVLGFALSGLTITRVGILSGLEQRQVCRRLAQSALAEAVQRLSDPANQNQTSLPSVEINSGEGRGLLAFTSTEATRLGIGRSDNNLGGAGFTLAADGQRVPPATARLLAEGRSGSHVERIEALFSAPLFPYAIAATGAIESRGGLVVATLQGCTPESRQQLLSDPVKYGLPAHIISNAGQGQVLLGGPSTVCGDVRCSGAVVLQGTPVRVLGELRERADQAGLPTVQLRNFDPIACSVTCDQVVGATLPSAIYQRPTVVNGDLRITGDLEMRHCLLYVRGNLRVDGELKGTGTLAVEQNATLRGAYLKTSGRMAVLCGGDVTLQGDGAQETVFDGIIYALGRVRATRLTVTGALIAAGPAPAGQPQILLEDAAVLLDSNPVILATGATTNLQVSVAGGAALQVECVSHSAKAFTVHRTRFSEFQVDLENSVSVAAFGSEMAALFTSQSIPVNPVFDFTAPSGSPERQIARFGRYDAPGAAEAGVANIARYLNSQGTQEFGSFDPSLFLRWEERVRVTSFRYR